MSVWYSREYKCKANGSDKNKQGLENGMEFSKEIETLEGTHAEIKMEMKNQIVQLEKGKQ